MVRSKCFLFLSILTFALSGMSSSDTLRNQLTHINTEIKAVTRSWKEANAKIKSAQQKQLLPLYEKLKPIFENIITSPRFVTTMNNTVNQQFDSIVNNNATFKSVKAVNSISTYYSKNMHTYGQELYAAMADKAYCHLLGKKLAQKSKELAVTIIKLKQVVPE